MTRISATGPGTARDRGSSTAEYSLMVAALAAVLVAVIMAAGKIAGEGVGRACSSMSSQLVAAGDCTPASTTEGPGAGDGPAADDDSTSEDGARTTNNLGVATDGV